MIPADASFAHPDFLDEIEVDVYEVGDVVLLPDHVQRKVTAVRWTQREFLEIQAVYVEGASDFYYADQLTYVEGWERRVA